LFYIIGASGAGKDSLINYARNRINGSLPILLVIAWLAMPGLDALALTSRIRQHLLLQRSYVFLVSDQEGEEAEERAFTVVAVPSSRFGSKRTIAKIEKKYAKFNIPQMPVATCVPPRFI
jgi:CheY-like chemotaxis protein